MDKINTSSVNPFNFTSPGISTSKVQNDNVDNKEHKAGEQRLEYQAVILKQLDGSRTIEYYEAGSWEKNNPIPYKGIVPKEVEDRYLAQSDLY